MKGAFTLAIVAGILLAVVLGCSTASNRNASSGASSAPNQPLIKSSLLEYTHRWNWSESGNYFHIEGQVKNVSGERLAGTRIVLTFYDKQGRLVTSDVTYPEYDPLMPGQSSPFKSMTAANPAIETYTVEFAARGGEQLPAMDVSTEKKKTTKK
jgi:hypothetical protein